MVNKDYPVIAWWSGGVASAVTCHICIEWFGKENVRVIFMDTKNEHPDTYRFKSDCEKWYGCNIEIISAGIDIEDIWFDSLSLNLAKGAKCTEVLKITPRQQFSKQNKFSHQAFGFDITETIRAKDMLKANYHLRPIFPLIANLYDKKDYINVIHKANDIFLKIDVPVTYKLGYNNNNCFNTGCVKGGIGYWQKIQKEEPEKFLSMAKREHELTDLKGEPVTMLKDQSEGGGLLFLLPHPNFPNIKDISTKRGHSVESLMDCNGFCSSNK